MHPAKHRWHTRWLLLIAIFWCFCFQCCAHQGLYATPADVVLPNGAVYTMAASRAWAEAVAIENGRIVYVGDETGIKPWIGSHTARIDLQGKMVLPGFHDSHVHPVADQLGECDLSGLTTQEQIFEAISRFAEQNPDAQWIRGGGWDLPLFPDGNPHKSLLDNIVLNRPAYLYSADEHSAWVNSRALQLAGIDMDTLDPPHGRIERDPKTGEPTGTLREDAMDLFSTHLPEYPPEDYLRDCAESWGWATV